MTAGIMAAEAYKKRPPNAAASGECFSERALLRHTLDRVGAEFRVFVADVLAQSLVLRVIPPSLDLVHAVPDLNHGALGRLSVKPGHLCSSGGPADGEDLTAGALMSACAFGAYSLA